MALSKPNTILQELVTSYLRNLYIHPLRTKSLTSCFISALGNLTAQYICGAKLIDQDAIIAFGLYGLIFGGPIQHYFYRFLDKVVPYNTQYKLIKQLLIERILFTPLYQYFAIYMVTRFQGKSHADSVKETNRVYWTLLKANLHILSIVQYINFKYIHPMLRVLVGNIVGFFWIIYFAYKKHRSAQAAADDARKKYPK